ncbi:hypothetical protein ISF_09709 [Cordyceps fumosorosea ARSEF 2679]|uniref:Uncharacterized protein n=1 Tax=Cordyceps fumosorosea (strain ARSEF 2679) TaxID=1081104 RepID=A0A167DL36_CORFA|nr:hypothetical protein ISF_09709 [Cordyceps fumosorosea ARSEF 2679]OAA42537.1 hypothetical protein ISF_09709 [Cordyceps fumosorosea ARSEF 2679]
MNCSNINGYNAFFVPAYDVVATTLSLLRHAESAPNASSLLAARTHETMMPLSAHCGIVATCVYKLVSRVCNRLLAAQALLTATDKDVVNARIATGTLMPPSDDGETEVSVHVYVSSFNLPYLFFHLVTIYNIPREEGVDPGQNGLYGCF